MQHIRVRQDDIGFVADCAPGILGRVAVIGMARERTADSIVQALQFQALILGKSFGGKKEDGPARGIREKRVKDGQVVAKGFAAGGGRDHNSIFSGERLFDSGGLMCVEVLDAAAGES
jgi:hypothetical protein